MAKRLTVVVSQGHSKNPAKRGLEEQIVAELLMQPGIDVTVIPNLYDLEADGTGMLCLQGIGGDMVILAWLFPRAAHWTLDRNGITGKVGTTLLVGDDDEEEEMDTAVEAEANDKLRVLDGRAQSNRTIYCLDLRIADSAEDYLAEIHRIAQETTTEVIGLGDWANGSVSAEQAQRYQSPTNDTALSADGATNGQVPLETANGSAAPVRIDDKAARRWYPVIDFSRCTNCMECIDFCLFGVYGIDGVENILVEQPDNCRKGCPACSRVCPENAIIFPQHKTPAIAGSNEGVESLKIDLSLLFGGADGESADDAAARERNEQLAIAGREAVELTKPVAAVTPAAPTPAAEKDELDDLMDQLDDLDL